MNVSSKSKLWKNKKKSPRTRGDATGLQTLESFSIGRFSHHGRQIAGSTTAFLARNFNVKQDALGNTDGKILFIFPDWYFGALIFSYSVVNAVAKRRSKFAFDRSQ